MKCGELEVRQFETRAQMGAAAAADIRDRILQLLQDMCRKSGMTVIIITHNGALTAMADRVIKVRSGTVTSVEVNEHPQNIAEIEW